MIRVNKTAIPYCIPFLLTLAYALYYQYPPNVVALTFILYYIFSIVLISLSLNVKALIKRVFFILFWVYFAVFLSILVMQLAAIPRIIFVRGVDSFSDFIVKFTDHDAKFTLFLFLNEVSAIVGLIFIIRKWKEWNG